jgi:hypothetical protein
MESINNQQNNNITQDKEKILKRKQYLKEYKEKNKDKIKNYESNKYTKERNEKHKLYVKKNAEILKLLKQAYLNNEIIINNETILKKLKELL